MLNPFHVALLVIATLFAVEGWRIYRGQCLRGPPNTELYGRSRPQCQDECWKETSFMCKSVEYFESNQTCYLRDDNSLLTAKDDGCESDLLEVTIGSRWNHYDHACLNVNFERVVEDVLQTICQEMCETESEFRCNSYTFDDYNDRCYLTSASHLTSVLENPCNQTETSYHYWNASSWLYMDDTHIGPIASLYNFTATSFWECTESCTENEFCAGVVYRTAECLLKENYGNPAPSGTWDAILSVHRASWFEITDQHLESSAIFRSIEDKTPNGCFEACELERIPWDPVGRCRSVMHNASSMECHLSRASRFSFNPPLVPVEPNVRYYEMTDALCRI